MVTKRPTGLNLSSILTPTIVWGGLQGQNIYRRTLRALTHQDDSQPLDAAECLWLTNAHSFYSMFSTIGWSWRLIGSCSAYLLCWTNSRGGWWEPWQIRDFTHLVLFFLLIFAFYFCIRKSKTLWQHQSKAMQNSTIQLHSSDQNNS